MFLTNPIASGNSSKIYVHKGNIVKIFDGGLSDTEAASEAGKQRYVRSLGVRVPKVHEVTKIDGKLAIIMDFIDGETIGNIIGRDMSKVEKFMKLAVDIQLRLHSIEAPKMEPMEERLTRQIRASVRLNGKDKNIILKRLDSLQQDKKLCHGDFHVYNLIIKDDRVTIIDWVDASAGNARADVYRSYLSYLRYSAFWADIYLKMYCDKSGMSQDEIFAWEPVVAAARLSDPASENEPWLIDILSKYCQI